MINLPMSDDTRRENAALLKELGSAAITYATKRERLQRDKSARTDGYRSQLEADYAAYLSALGLSFHYEILNINIGEDLAYTPDFDFNDVDGVFTVVELKGNRKMKNARDSLTRFKVAASMYPRWRWQWIERGPGGEWLVKYEYGVKA